MPMKTLTDDPYPKYEVLEIKGNGSWCVVVTPTEHGRPYELYGFVSEADARDWIRKEAKRKDP
jgi:hypothetical protein